MTAGSVCRISPDPRALCVAQFRVSGAKGSVVAVSSPAMVAGCLFTNLPDVLDGPFGMVPSGQALGSGFCARALVDAGASMCLETAPQADFEFGSASMEDFSHVLSEGGTDIDAWASAVSWVEISEPEGVRWGEGVPDVLIGEMFAGLERLLPGSELAIVSSECLSLPSMDGMVTALGFSSKVFAAQDAFLLSRGCGEGGAATARMAPGSP